MTPRAPLMASVRNCIRSLPLVSTVLHGVITAGVAQGFAFALQMAVTAALSVSIPHLIQEGTGRTVTRSTVEWSIELLLVAVVAGYGRRLFGEAEERHHLALDRMSRLAEANALLFSLHRVAQSLPASLDMDEVVDSTMRRLRDLLEFDAAAVFLLDETTGSWIAAKVDGSIAARTLEPAHLPPPIRRALASSVPITVT